MPPLGKSDHAVFLNFCCDVKTVSASHASSCNYQKGKYDELQNSLDIDWDQALCPKDYSVDEMWHLLKNKLLNGIDKYIPMTCNRPPKRHAVQPFSNDIKQLRNRKHRLWTRYMETRELAVLTEYKRVRNIVKSKARKINKFKQESIAKLTKTSPKHFWKYIKTKTNMSINVRELKSMDADGKEI